MDTPTIEETRRRRTYSTTYHRDPYVMLSQAQADIDFLLAEVEKRDKEIERLKASRRLRRERL